MPDSVPSQDERIEWGILRVLQYASSFSLGVLAGFLYSVEQVNPTVRFEFGLGTVCSFLFMAGITWFFWRLLLDKHHLEGSSPKDCRVRTLGLIGLSVLLVGGMILASLRAMQTLPRHRYLDMVEGTSMAFVVIAAIAVGFWRIVRYLEADHQRGIHQQQQPHDE